MSGEYVARTAALQAVGDVHPLDYNGQGIVERIKAIPAADVRPVVKAKWVWLSSTYDRIPCEMRYECSACYHETISHGNKPWEKFCPNCGAKMDGGQDA